MSDIYASLSGRTGRIRQRQGAPIASGVRRGSRLTSGRYRLTFSDPQPDTAYIVGLSTAPGLLGMVAATTTTQVEVAYHALDGSPAQPAVVTVSVHRIGQREG